MKRLFPLFLVLILPLLSSGCVRVIATHTYQPQRQHLCSRCKYACDYTSHRQYYRFYPTSPTNFEVGVSSRGYYYHDYSNNHRHPQRVVQQNNYYSEHHNYVTTSQTPRRSAKKYRTATRSVRERMTRGRQQNARQHPTIDRQGPRRTVQRQHPTPARRRVAERSRFSQPDRQGHTTSSRQRIQERQERVKKRRSSAERRRR